MGQYNSTQRDCHGLMLTVLWTVPRDRYLLRPFIGWMDSGLVVALTTDRPTWTGKDITLAAWEGSQFERQLVHKCWFWKRERKLPSFDLLFQTVISMELYTLRAGFGDREKRVIGVVRTESSQG